MSAPAAREGRRAPGWLARLWGVTAAHRRDLVITITAAILGSLCQVLVPLVERQIVDGVIVRRDSPLAVWLALLLALAAATFGFAYVRRYRAGRLALAVQYDLRNAMHDHLQAMDFANLDRMPTGQLVARANSDSSLVQGLLGFFPIISGNVLMVILSLAAMFYLAPLLALVSLLVVPALFSSPTGCAGASFPPPGTASSVRATSPRSSMRTSAACASSRPLARSAGSLTASSRAPSGSTARACARCACSRATSRCSQRSRRLGRSRSSRSVAGSRCATGSRSEPSSPSRPT